MSEVDDEREPEPEGDDEFTAAQEGDYEPEDAPVEDEDRPLDDDEADDEDLPDAERPVVLDDDTDAE
ncbi:hypothetical protein OSC27_03000 [Microbacterium sp. STN6]|uniref:hypothetical protein n=1 Tax=Microbacterium sp. STN6 TaxID=2995588 RepID=UPI002260A9A6|nr:hypothetical protein [Microbacterium sp. STN6]MCX7521244.1 hypothetical protein [Microbacterium sp. STN6]